MSKMMWSMVSKAAENILIPQISVTLSGVRGQHYDYSIVGSTGMPRPEGSKSEARQTDGVLEDGMLPSPPASGLWGPL